MKKKDNLQLLNQNRIEKLAGSTLMDISGCKHLSSLVACMYTHPHPPTPEKDVSTDQIQ